MKKILLAAVAAMALGWAGTAAPTTVLNLGEGNSDIIGYPGPYGNVTINLLDSTHATVVFASDNVGANDFFFIDSGIADVNVNATSFSLSNLVTNGLGSPTIGGGGSGNVDGAGSFNEVIDQHDGFGSRATTISFELTNLGGTWGSDALVLTPDNNGFEAAAHVAVCPNTAANYYCGAGSSAIATGYAANGPTGVPVPEPATWALMIIGVGAIGAFMRRQRGQILAAAAA